MAKIKRRNVDSVRRGPVRKSSYSAPTVRKGSRRVPDEYKTLQRPKNSPAGFLAFLFILLIAAWAGFFFWNQKTNVVVQESLEMEIIGPDKVVSGDQVTYQVRYKNRDVVPLTKMELSVRWPSGFYFDESSSEPKDSNANSWRLENLPAGQEEVLEIKGQLVGPKDSEVTAYFNLTYEPENFTSEFKAKQNIVTKITDTSVDIVLESPEKTLVNTPIQMKIKFTNTTKDKLEGVALDVILPADLDVETIEPAKDGQYWLLDLEPGVEQELTITGEFSSDAKPDQMLVAEIGTLSEEEDFRRLARSEQPIAVVSPEFDVILTINGENRSQSASWGDVLRYQAEIKNQSDSDIPDVKVNALLDGAVLDWNTMDTAGDQNEPNITWTSEQDEALSLWPAGETKTFTWQVKVVDDPQPERSIENIIQINIEGLESWVQTEPAILVTVGESIAFNAGVYWELANRRVGSGLLPPVVGQQTQYLAIFSIPEATGNFSSVLVETSLPPEVEYVSETDVQIGVLEYDEDSRQLSWKIDNFGDLILPATASFMIELTPTSEFEGKAMTLINPIEVSASGQEEVVVKSKLIKTTDVYANSTQAFGIIQ